MTTTSRRSSKWIPAMAAALFVVAGNAAADGVIGAVDPSTGKLTAPGAQQMPHAGEALRQDAPKAPVQVRSMLEGGVMHIVGDRFARPLRAETGVAGDVQIRHDEH